ncbi:MAG TPA: hypothetical protein VHW01_18145 [Polyangiaceae bacterium]|jgi:hypothetical protein|nr:hypothetical protein [Polyangiaceae bacterium]
MTGELFELEMLGGTTEQRFRRMRPEVEAMPWGTLDLSKVTAEQCIAARKAWTGSAYQEHRTGAACALTLQALIEARAPLDLIAVGSRFPLDEMVHVELCARMAMEFGGGTEIIHDPKAMVLGSDAALSPLMQAADLVVRFFCVGEAISIPLLRATWHVAKHPLPKAVLGRIVKDEAAHGVFGYTFLDWACPRFSAEEKARLGVSADLAIRFLYGQWVDLQKRRDEPRLEDDVLGWMQTGAYLKLACRSMQTLVIDPLEARGIPIAAQVSEFLSLELES